MIVECIRYRPVNVGTFAGFADLYIHEYNLEILGCTLYKKEDKRWLNLPVRTYKNNDNEEKYSSIIRFRDQKDFRDFCKLSKDAIDKFVESEEQVKNV
jgi:hypothetical protein